MRTSRALYPLKQHSFCTHKNYWNDFELDSMNFESRECATNFFLDYTKNVNNNGYTCPKKA